MAGINTTLANVYVETYESIVRHLAQQQIARARPWVMEKSVQSAGHNWERLAKSTAIEKTAVGGPTNGGSSTVPTPENETVFSRRRSAPGTWHIGDVTETEDIAQVLIDPNSNIAQSQSYAMSRAIDAEIFNAAERDADDGNGGTPIPYDVNQEIGDGTASITFDTITEVTEKFMDNDIDPDIPKVAIISPAQARKLLQLTEATSGDYNAVRPLTSKGYIESWMGYTWVVSTQLNLGTAAGSSLGAGTVNCLFMTRKAIGLQMNKDVWVRVAQDPSISFAWRIYCQATYGGVRVEDEHLVKVALSETI
tara:strand:- start:5698 stop:6621 length:924 start_codon:yes stop_codon:yes gene_type:complete